MGVENYDVIELVGEGSFGKVYKGRRKLTDQTVAMKFIMKHGKSDEDIHNLRQEIEILRKLKHENIIEMLDSFESPQEFCVVTEFAQGELFEILEDDKHLPEEQVQAIAKQLVRALHYLHSNRIIHRDMKPQNILIGAGSIVKLCDFGFTCAMSKNKGTPLYMAPELVREQPYNHAADLWSLGVILYELFVGQPPYTNSGYALVPHNVKDPVKYPDNMSSSFKNFLKGLLNKMPQNRLAWPALLEHPFVKDTTEELEAREKRSATAAEKGFIAAWRGEGDKIQTPGGKMTSSASSDDKSGISFQNAQSYISHSQAVCSPLNEEFPGFANADEVKQTGSQIIDGLENNSRTVKGALMIGQDIEALAHVLLPIKRCSQGSQNSSRDQDILNSNQSLRIFSNLVAAGAITSSGLLDEIIHEILVYTTFIVSIKSSELNELIAKSFSIIKVLVDNVKHGIGCSYFNHWVALADIFSQVVSCSEGASGGVMFESIACITVMLTRVNQGLKALSSTPALQEVSGPYETVKQILDHAKTSGLVDQLCLCLATSGAGLISGSSNMLRSACEACRAIWLLIESSEFLSTKRNAISFPLNTMRSPARDQDRGGSVIWTESAELVAVVTRAIIRSKSVQVAIHYCLHQRLEASLYAGIQLLLKCCLHSAIVPGILCGLPSSVPVTTVVSGGGDRTIISEIFSLLSLCISSQNKDPQAIETTNLKCKITDPNTLVLHSCLILASVAQCLKVTGRNSALFMLTTSSENQLSRLSVLAHHFSSGECINSSSRTHSASAMLALASILSLESGASVGSSVFELAVPLIPEINTLCEYLKLPPNREIVSVPNGSNGAPSNWHGVRDGCVGLLEARLRSGGPFVVQQMCASNVPLVLINLLAKKQQIGFPSLEEEISATDQVGLSPIGVLWTISSIRQCLSRGAVTFRQFLLRIDHIKLFYDMICDMHLKLVRSCDGMDGGYYRDVINAIIDLLAVPFVTVQNAPSLPSATASLINRILLKMGSPGFKVCMEDRDMVKVIEDLGKYINILSEVGVFGMVACSERGTLIGVLPFKEGLVAYVDCRGTILKHAPDEEEIDDDQEKFSTISSTSNIYYLKSGNADLAKDLAKYLAEDVKKAEEDPTLPDLCDIDAVEKMVHRELSRFTKTAPSKLLEHGVGGIFIGWAADQTYRAFDIYATNYVQVVWLMTGTDILEANTHVGCSDIAVRCFKAAKDMLVSPRFKETIESGSGAPFAEAILPSMMAGNYEKSLAEVKRIAVKTSNHVSLHTRDVGGTTKVRVFTHGEPFIPVLCEAYTPVVVQFYDTAFSDHLILMRIHQPPFGNSTVFEKSMSKWKGVFNASFFFSKNGYRYYRVLTTEDARIVFAELTRESVEIDGLFFLVDYRVNMVDIKLGVAFCTQDALRSI